MNVHPLFREIKNQRYVPLIFLVLGLLLIYKNLHNPVKDFGNYYYGSKLLIEGRFTQQMYSDIHYFNQQISNFGETDFFENYIPVPPFTAIFYAPLCLFKSNVAKLFFNLLSLFLFCAALYRLMRYYGVYSNYLLLLPLLFLYPINNNIDQGQTYLLILALLSEAVIRSETGQKQVPALLLALCMALKIFPAFMLLFFILKKRYPVVIWSLVYFISLNCLSMIFIKPDIVVNYYTNVLPRLANNDIIGTYYYSNQSIYSFLLNVFSYDLLQNSHPLINMPYLAPLLESAFIALIAGFLIAFRNHKTILLFGICCLALILCSRYNTSYSLVLLFPVALHLNSQKHPTRATIAVFLLLLFGLNLNPSLFKYFNVILQFSRLFFLLFVFIILVRYYQVKPNFKVILLLFIPLVAYRCYSFPIKQINYFPTQNANGILYDINIVNDSLIMYSTLGAKTKIEKFALKGEARFDEELKLDGTKMLYKGETVLESPDNKLNPFLYNDSLIVFMSDLNQAVRFYKLRMIKRND